MCHKENNKHKSSGLPLRDIIRRAGAAADQITL
jgi:hypothetical protein